MGEQLLQLRAEDHAAVRQRRHVQRLHPQPVARQQQGALPQVIEREGEHAVQARQAIHAPFLPGGEDHLAVAIGTEGCAACLQFAAQFAEIIDLAVEHQHCRTIGRGHRLR